MGIYVVMTDNFMSGWGPAEGKRNRFVVSCDTDKQADQIIRAANERSEMSGVGVVSVEPRDTNMDLVTLRQFHTLGEAWTGIEQ